MRSRGPFIFILVLLFALLEAYSFNGLKPFINSLNNKEVYWSVYFLFALVSLISIVVFVNNVADQKVGELKKASINVFGGLAFTLLLTILAFNLVLFTEDVFRIVVLGYDSFSSFFVGSDEVISLSSRNNQVAQIGLGIAAIPFVSFIHGITLGKYKFQVKRINLSFKDLPRQFQGYKIVQFSDMHSGSFDSLERVKKGIEKINKEEADLILFTGDMVNNLADEVEPFIPMLSELKAKDGKYSILGNHDYGDYIKWASKEAKINNLYRLISYQEKAGFQLLMNENVSINRNEEKIVLAGVENWGKPPFPQHGDLTKALEDVTEGDFTILMSHDPSHWDLEVLKRNQKVHITLSGHTHGMQFGLDIPGLKWSPVKYKYPRWSGLYDELGRYLYVNNGFGFLGFPGRVGIYPEITVIELSVAE